MDVALNKVPQHVAIIMDGNGRWAKARNKPRTQGHMEGLKRVEEMIDFASCIGIRYLTLFAFSTENWRRPELEVQDLMQLFLSAIEHKVSDLHENNIRIKFIGSHEGVSDKLLSKIKEAESLTIDNDEMIVLVAFNYGARQEILHAVRQLIDQGISSDHLNEQALADCLHTKDIPDPDLLIRTSGEQRISNFLLWQLSYTELYFTPTHWPDFTSDEFMKALKDFESRDRRYGSFEC